MRKVVVLGSGGQWPWEDRQQFMVQSGIREKYATAGGALSMGAQQEGIMNETEVRGLGNR